MEENKDKKKEDELVIVPLGSGCEVGRSCILMKFKGKKIMFDCGLHQGKEGYESLPYFDQCTSQEIQELDLILISHFHTDHCAALPYFLKETPFLKGNGKIYMTSPTKAIFKPFTQDSLKLKSENIKLYKKEDIDMTMRHIDIINFNQEFEYNGIKFKCYCAGHVLGAAMFQVEIDGVKVLYTGDYSTEIERLMQPAEIPQEHIDILIVESTFGKDKHKARKDREERLKELIYNVVKPKPDGEGKQGKVLLPVTTSGRAEELLLILDELWEERPEIQDIPIQFKSKKFDKFKEIFQIYLELTPKEIRNKTINPFDLKHVTVTKEGTDFEKVNKIQRDKPCVVLASPGQMNDGSNSREIFHEWCTDPDNLCILTGFAQEGSFARSLQNNPKLELKMGDEKVISKIQIETVPFCAHADFDQTRQFISSIEPDYIVLVHGQEKKAKELQRELQKEFKQKVKKVVAPKNQEQEKFYFQQRQHCKIIGSLQDKIQEKIESFNQQVKQICQKDEKIQEKQEDEIENEDNQIKEEQKSQQGDVEQQDNKKSEDNLECSFDEEIPEIKEKKEDIEPKCEQVENEEDNKDKKEEIIQQKIKIDGLLYQNEVKQMFLFDPKDKNVDFPVKKMQIKEKLKLQYSGDMEILAFFAQQIVHPKCQIETDDNGRQFLRVKDNFKIEKLDSETIQFEWIAGLLTQELVENFSLLVIQLQNQQTNLQDVQDSDNSQNHIFRILTEEYPMTRIDVSTNTIMISSQEQHEIATINLNTHELHTNDEFTRKKILGLLSLIEEFQIANK